MKHLVIPDVQFKPGNDPLFLRAIGNYIVAKKPDVVVCIGDFADMPSLSSYDRGTKNFEGRRYKADVESVHVAMEALMEPIRENDLASKRNHKARYNPRMVLTLGNHEDRITRAVNSDPKLDGTIGITDLRYESFGWEVHPYLSPVVIDGIAYCHFFTSGIMGRPVASSRHLVQKKHMSCTMGHVQNWEIHREVRADGKPVLGLFSGSCYEHDEDYLGPQGNTYDRGIWLKNEVQDGHYHPLYVSLKYLKSKYL
jgi:Calcineurin-like phosphoesterase